MKHDLRIAVTKKMIQDALLGLLEKKELEKIKVSELCAASGINRSTFYRHYETLQDVLREIEINLVARMPRLGETPRNAAEVQACLEEICGYIYRHRDTVKILFRSNTDVDMMRFINGIYRNVLEQRSKQNLTDLDEDTVRIIIAMMSGGGYYLLRLWILEEIPKTPKEIAQIMCSVIRMPDSHEGLQ